MSSDIDLKDDRTEHIAAVGRKIAAIPQPPRLNLVLPKLDLPRVELTQFKFMIAEQSGRWRETMAPLTALGERFRKQLEAMQSSLAPLAAQVRWLEQQERQCERIERAGWLPHRSSPFGLLADDLADEAIEGLIADHYQANWDEISSGLQLEIDQCELDDEAKQCFAEALAAHGAGFYRCAPRLLFPEVERVARAELHGGTLDRITNQKRLMEAIGGLTPAEMASTGVTGLRFYRKLTEHLYQSLKDPERVATAKADPVPNRHAAVHGLISYTSAKSSLNALLIADYLLQAISTIKRLARDDTGD